MPLDIPDSPSIGDTYNVGDRTWRFNGTTWDAVLFSAPTGPTGPAGSNGSDGATGPTGPAGELTRSVRTVSESTSLVSGDQNQIIRFTGTSSQVLTVDDVLAPGSSVEIFQDNSGSVEFQSGSGVTLLSNSGNFLSNVQNNVIKLSCIAAGEYRLFGTLEAVNVSVEYLVIAGGGGGGYYRGGGGGAGGYRSSVVGENSGGGTSAETIFTAEKLTSYTVSIGAGGACGVNDPDTILNRGFQGSSSIFSTITSIGGGGAGGGGPSTVSGAGAGLSGGSGGGGGGDGPGSHAGGVGTAGQGFAGENGVEDVSAGGGGGAGEAGGADAAGQGGDGVSSSITGSAVTRGGGGASGTNSGGDGGGGGSGSPGAVNTGGGGGGDVGGSQIGNGGSGIVILRYPADNTLTVGAGLTADPPTTVGANKVTVITAGTGTVSFS